MAYASSIKIVDCNAEQGHEIFRVSQVDPNRPVANATALHEPVAKSNKNDRIRNLCR